MRLTGHGLMVAASGVSRERLRARIGATYGVRVRLVGRFADPVTLSFKDLSPRQAIERVAGGAPSVILHAAGSTLGAAAPPIEIWLYAAARLTPSPRVRTLAPGGRSRPSRWRPVIRSPRITKAGP